MIPLWKYPFCSVIRIKIFGANCEILFALGLDWKWTEDIASSRQSRLELSNWAWSHRLKITVYCTLYNCCIVTGRKLPGNSFKWERGGPATTQAGARISHYRQNQNNPHLRTQHLGIQINPWENPLVKFWRTWHQNNMRYVGFSTCMWGLCEYYHSEINKIGKVFTLVRRG